MNFEAYTNKARSKATPWLHDFKQLFQSLFKNLFPKSLR